jgi:hypothetical protein
MPVREAIAHSFNAMAYYREELGIPRRLEYSITTGLERAAAAMTPPTAAMTLQ